MAVLCVFSKLIHLFHPPFWIKFGWASFRMKLILNRYELNKHKSNWFQNTCSVLQHVFNSSSTETQRTLGNIMKHFQTQSYFYTNVTLLWLTICEYLRGVTLFPLQFSATLNSAPTRILHKQEFCTNRDLCCSPFNVQFQTAFKIIAWKMCSLLCSSLRMWPTKYWHD